MTRTNTRVSEIVENGVRVINEHGEQELIEADVVVAAFGMAPNTELTNALKQRYNKKLVCVGDCVEVGKSGKSNSRRLLCRYADRLIHKEEINYGYHERLRRHRTHSELGLDGKEIPEPGPFEALCSPVAVLPCTSDVHSAHFRNAWPNRILGHEGVGRVEKVGAMVTDIHVGDIVAVPAVTPIWRGRQIAEGLHEHTGGFLGDVTSRPSWTARLANTSSFPMRT